MNYDELKQAAEAAVKELIEIAKLREGQTLIVGCSSSEVKDSNIGKNSDIDAARAIYDGIMPVLKEKGIFLAAQCCEHLNRAVVIERAALKPWQEEVNVVPQMHAGGSFATTFYANAENPCVIEFIRADAGMDIGDTLIGMQLKHVAVPVRLSVKKIGEANLVCARTRAKYIGGSRAIYNDKLSGGDIER